MTEPQFTPEESQNEAWKPVVGWDEFYSVSSLGRVRRELQRGGARPGRILKAVFPKSTKRPTVILCREGRKTTKPIHVLVARAFLGERPLGLVVNHKDGDKRNNRSDNLEYVTQAENAAHAKRLGLCPSGARHGRYTKPERTARGERHGTKTKPERVARGDHHYYRTSPEKILKGESIGTAKLAARDVLEIRKQLEAGLPLSLMVDKWGIGNSQLRRIRDRQSWKHLV